MSIRSVVNRVLKKQGLELRDLHAHAKRHRGCMDLLVRRGFKPGTLVDIGVATGTPWLYERFRECKLVLIDPNPVFAKDLSRLGRVHNADVYANAVGAQEGQVDLNIDGVAPSSSSLLAISAGLAAKWAESGRSRGSKVVTVPMMTLDATLAGKGYQTPFMVKLDTEGYEREVLLGATETLRQTEVVIAEVSVMRRFEGSYEFADFVRLLDERGFRLFDLLDVTTFGREGPINYLDAASFVRTRAYGPDEPPLFRGFALSSHSCVSSHVDPL